ncbi:hypothetical protein H4R19_003022, partial [Coemansia spiralis]
RQQQQQQQRPQQRPQQDADDRGGYSSSRYASRSAQEPSRQPAQQQMTKEELFRAKFERSQQEWDAQKRGAPQVNPATVSDMHKVSLGHGGRGAADNKQRGLKRFL